MPHTTTQPKPRWGLMAVTLALLAAACTSGSSPIAEPPTVVAETAVAEEPTSTPEPPTPTPVPVVVSDQDRITAALAQLEADVAAGEGPGHIAYDVLDQNINADGDVTFTLCTWTRDTVFDEVRDSLYRTTTTDTGDVTATHITTPLTTGDCLNTELINTAFDFIDEYDIVRAEWSRNPASFASDARSNGLVQPAMGERLADLMQTFVDDNVYFEPAHQPGDGRTQAVNVLLRASRIDGEQVLDVVLCRPMNPGRGKYRGNVLIDDGRPEEDAGPHGAKAYALVPSSNEEPGWSLQGESSRIWADCNVDGLASIIQGWIGSDTPFEEIDL